MKRKKIIPLIIALLFVTGVTLYFEVFRHMTGRRRGIEGSGKIEVAEVDLASKIAGRVLELSAEEGQDVMKGKLLVRLSSDELGAQRSSALASLEERREEPGAYRTFVQDRGRLARGTTTTRSPPTVVARAGYDYIAETIGETVIYAPMNGTVLERNLEPGELAFPGTPVMTLADLSRPWIRIYVREQDLGLVKNGQRAEITVDSFPGRKFAGRVSHIASRAEFTPRTIQTKEERVKLVFAVKIMIENDRGALKPGMPADALIITEDAK
jgi:HlyD family secretion protein